MAGPAFTGLRTVVGSRRRMGLRLILICILTLSSAITVSASVGAAEPASAAGSVVAVSPARIADSRTGQQISGAVPGRGTVTVGVAGRGGVPASGVSAAVLTVTADNAQAAGYLTVWPTGVSIPATSSLNFGPGQAVSNTVITPVGGDGNIQIFNAAAASVQIVIDVTGYVVAGNATAAGSVVPIVPQRIADSRSRQQIDGAVGAQGTARVQIAGVGAIPASGIAAAVLNVTVDSPGAAGYLTVWPTGIAQPGTSNLNFAAGQAIANTVIAAVGADGAVQISNAAGSSVSVIVDIMGYVLPNDANTAGALVPTTPARIADSRAGKQISGQIPALGSVTVQVGGYGPVPWGGAAAAVLNVTAVNANSAGYLTVFPPGRARPGISNVNFHAAQVISNAVLTSLSTSGKIQIFNGAPGPVDVVVDVTGFVMSQPAPTGTPWDNGPVRTDRDANDTKFTIAVMPDTQQEVSSPDTRFKNRSDWLVKNAGPGGLDLRFVTHTGDVVNWDTDSHDQYEWASQGLQPLSDAGIPWSLSNGNHDNEATAVGGGPRDPKNTRTLVRDTSVFNRYFTAAKYGDVTGGFEQGKVDNVYSRFYAGGKSWLVLNLELWPRVEVVNWAKSVVANHPHDNVIVTTHSYLNDDGTIYQNTDYGSTSPQYLYDNLISRYVNIKMVFSGHVGIAASRTDVGVNGNTIYSFLAAIHSNSTNPIRIVYINTGAGTLQSRIVAPFDNAGTWASYDLDINVVSWVS